MNIFLSTFVNGDSVTMGIVLLLLCSYFQKMGKISEIEHVFHKQVSVFPMYAAVVRRRRGVFQFCDLSGVQ